MNFKHFKPDFNISNEQREAMRAISSDLQVLGDGVLSMKMSAEDFAEAVDKIQADHDCFPVFKNDYEAKIAFHKRMMSNCYNEGREHDAVTHADRIQYLKAEAAEKGITL